MKYVWILVFLSITLVFLSFQSAFALSCEGPTWDEEFDQVGVVFTGKVIAKEYLPPKYDKPYEKYAISTIQVEEIFKGSLNDTVKIKSNEGFWGINLFEDWRYLIFGRGADDHVSIAMCTNSGSLPPIPDPEKIGHIQDAEYRMNQLNALLLDKKLSSSEQKQTSQVFSDRISAKTELLENLEREFEGREWLASEKKSMDRDLISYIARSGDNNVYNYFALNGEVKLTYLQYEWRTLLSPAEQMEGGLSTKEVLCYNDHLSIIRTQRDAAVCVTPSTAQKLVERGWGVSTDLTRFDKIELIKKCGVGRYGESHALGSFSITIEKQESEICFLKYLVDLEGGFSETACEIPLNELAKFQGWKKGSWTPNFEKELGKYCELKKQWSLLDFLP